MLVSHDTSIVVASYFKKVHTKSSSLNLGVAYLPLYPSSHVEGRQSSIHIPLNKAPIEVHPAPIDRTRSLLSALTGLKLVNAL